MNTYLCPIIEGKELSIQLIKANSKSEALYDFAISCLDAHEKQELLDANREYNEENTDEELSLDGVLEYLEDTHSIQIGEMYDINYWDFQINN